MGETHKEKDAAPDLSSLLETIYSDRRDTEYNEGNEASLFL
jgi:hypothetical protein